MKKSPCEAAWLGLKVSLSFLLISYIGLGDMGRNGSDPGRQFQGRSRVLDTVVSHRAQAPLLTARVAAGGISLTSTPTLLSKERVRTLKTLR